MQTPTTATRTTLDALMEEYVACHPRSRALFERACQALPGGDTRTTVYFRPFPPYIERGDGCRMYDVDGHVLLDLLANYTSMIWGYAHPEIVEAIRRQAALGSSFAAPTEDQVRLAELLRERLPSLAKVRFTNSGTEAAMNAMRAARAFTGRSKIVKIEGGYHGSSDAAEISVRPDPASAGPAARPHAVPARGVPASVAREVIPAPFNDAGAVEAILRAHPGEIAALIVEPVMGAGGVIPPRDGFLTALRRLTEAMDIVLIFDEVISFRLDYHGAQARYGVRPDLTVLGKIIGGGLPVGAFGGREEIMALYDPRHPSGLAHGGTFNANALTVAAGVAGLALLTAPEIDRLNAEGDELRARLQALFDASPVPARVSGVGSLLQVHFTGGDVADYRDGARGDVALSTAFHLALLLEGAFVAPRGMMALSLPMRNAELDEAVGTAGRALARLVDAGAPR